MNIVPLPTRVTRINTDSLVLANALKLASETTELLAKEGIRVRGSYANGRRPVLIVDGPPPGVRAGMKGFHPGGAGKTVFHFAAVFNDCQLEWHHEVETLGIVPVTGHG